jgi:hypothetical protein
MVLGSPLLGSLPLDSELDYPLPRHDQRNQEPLEHVDHCWPSSEKLKEARIHPCLLSGLVVGGCPSVG